MGWTKEVVRSAAEREPGLIRVADIQVGERLRPLDQDALERLIASIRTIGLQNPITVRPGDGWGLYRLVAGYHRLRAVEALGEPVIAATVVEWDDRTARMWEIAENLHRADLSALERSEHIAEWDRLATEKQALQAVQGEPLESRRADGRGHRREGGERAAARELGLDRLKLRRAKQVAALSPEAKAAAIECGLHTNQAALLTVAAVPNAQQVAVVKDLAQEKREGKAKRAVAKPEAHGPEALAQALWKPLITTPQIEQIHAATSFAQIETLLEQIDDETVLCLFTVAFRRLVQTRIGARLRSLNGKDAASLNGKDAACLEPHEVEERDGLRRLEAQGGIPLPDLCDWVDDVQEAVRDIVWRGDLLPSLDETGPQNQRRKVVLGYRRVKAAEWEGRLEARHRDVRTPGCSPRPG